MIKLHELLWNRKITGSDKLKNLTDALTENRTNKMVYPDLNGGGGGCTCYSNLPVGPNNPTPRCR